ncbi:hypothetical protein OUZ56_022700 [Daphnia magna]|uniref:Uncharacterized protein n=1 Tax=Daphnia magna TaxID=35525 RepID=A0ABR0AX93_9CRUS|nr:hypothetical protein OUZ56_022700 [Daphnia magna]
MTPAGCQLSGMRSGSSKPKFVFFLVQRWNVEETGGAVFDAYGKQQKPFPMGTLNKTPPTASVAFLSSPVQRLNAYTSQTLIEFDTLDGSVLCVWNYCRLLLCASILQLPHNS